MAVRIFRDHKPTVIYINHLRSSDIFFLDVWGRQLPLHILLPLHKGCYLADCRKPGQLFPKKNIPDGLHKLKN
jgi:hypothetical protein